MIMLVDTTDLYVCAKNFLCGRLDYDKLYQKIQPDEAIAYITNTQKAIDFATKLRYIGYKVKTRHPISRTVNGISIKEYNFSVMLSIDAIDAMAKGTNRIWIVSANLSLLPLMEYLKECGCEVNLAGIRLHKAMAEIADSTMEIGFDYVDDSHPNTKPPAPDSVDGKMDEAAGGNATP